MVEFRLYYDDTGKVICYTCDKLPNNDNYIVIDKETYAATNPNVRVIDGKIVPETSMVFVSRLVESDVGVCCEPDDICIIVEQGTHWKMETYEFRNS